MTSKKDFWKEDVKKYFSDMWSIRRDQGVKFWQDDGFSYRICQNEALDQVGDINAKKVLIIGAGRGYEAQYFLNKNATVVVTDLLLDGLVGEDANNRTNIVSDAEQLSFCRNSFDMVYLQSVLMFVNKEKVLNEIYRVLKIEGIFVSVEPLAEGFLFWLLKKMLTKFQQYRELSKRPPAYMRMTDLNTMRQIFGQELYCRFRILTPFYHVFRMLKWNYFLLIYFNVEKKLIDTIPFLQKQCFLGIYLFQKRA